jgi:predicted flap endonuclease-1-like 5' DNA nuclease
MADLVLGPSGGNGGHEFDGYAIPAGAKVHEIRVNAGFYVDGLQLVCIDSMGAVQELPHLGGKGGLHHTITLDADEYLTGVSGRSGRYLDSIRFHTNKRTTDAIGGPGGENEFHFEAAANGEVAGFFGRADWYVDRLGVIVRDRIWRQSTSVPVSTPAASMATTPEATTAAKSRKKSAAVESVAPASGVTASSAAKPATKSRKKTAPDTDLVALPDAPPVSPPAPDLIGIPNSGTVTPPAPDLVGMPNSGPVDATTPELIGVPGSTPVEVESAAMAAGTRTHTLATGADDLVKIEGIGPKIAQILNDAGITTFAALAGTEVSRLRALLDAAGNRYRMADPTTWPEQAAHAARGDWAAFNDLVARLKSGRKA